MIAQGFQDLAAATGNKFFQALLEHLQTNLEAGFVVVSQFIPGNCGYAVVRAASAGYDRLAGAARDLAGTPEEELLRTGRFAHYPMVRERFAGDARLASLQAHTWSGVLLKGSSGQNLGVLAVIFRRQAPPASRIEAELARFAPRAAAEIERAQTEEALRRSERRYEELIRHSTEAVWCIEYDSPISLELREDDIVAKAWEGRLHVANDAAARLVGLETASQVLHRRLSEFRDMLPTVESQFRQQIRSGFRIRWFEFPVTESDDTEHWHERSVVPIIEDGKLFRIWGATRDISERKRHEQEIQELNANLERIVADRTTQLAATNQELQAFSYSVSHDLRAAIQGILACGRIVLKEHGSRLDDAGKIWLNHMAEDAAQLDKLTLALLELSQVSRANLGRGPVDLSMLAESVAQRLFLTGGARKVDLRVAPGMMVSADSALLRGVLENLLGNAWKFTRTREAAEIEVGVDKAVSDEPVYFVRDNGVGFNMKYSEKLFGAFQRLHRIEDFEGTGIGLATVRRVIHRHGGRVWAEAEVNRGATFFFTLGKSGIP